MAGFSLAPRHSYLASHQLQLRCALCCPSHQGPQAAWTLVLEGAGMRPSRGNGLGGRSVCLGNVRAPQDGALCHGGAPALGLGYQDPQTILGKSLCVSASRWA